MGYFTEKEASTILKYGTIEELFWDKNNPNIASCYGLKAVLSRQENPNYYSAAIGYMLGVAAGKRQERDRKNVNKIHDKPK